MTDDLRFDDIPQRIAAILCYHWRYKGETTDLRVYSEGFVGRGNEKGPTYEALRQWFLGLKKPSQQSLLRLLIVINKQMDNPPSLTLAMLSTSVPIRELYGALGISPHRAEEFLFTHWAQHEAKLCKAYLFSSAEEAERFSQVHRPGLYLGNL